MLQCRDWAEEFKEFWWIIVGDACSFLNQWQQKGLFLHLARKLITRAPVRRFEGLFCGNPTSRRAMTENLKLPNLGPIKLLKASPWPRVTLGKEHCSCTKCQTHWPHRCPSQLRPRHSLSSTQPHSPACWRLSPWGIQQQFAQTVVCLMQRSSSVTECKPLGSFAAAVCVYGKAFPAKQWQGLQLSEKSSCP